MIRIVKRFLAIALFGLFGFMVLRTAHALITFSNPTEVRGELVGYTCEDFRSGDRHILHILDEEGNEVEIVTGGYNCRKLSELRASIGREVVYRHTPGNSLGFHSVAIEGRELVSKSRSLVDLVLANVLWGGTILYISLLLWRSQNSGEAEPNSIKR